MVQTNSDGKNQQGWQTNKSKCVQSSGSKWKEKTEKEKSCVKGEWVKKKKLTFVPRFVKAAVGSVFPKEKNLWQSPLQKRSRKSRKDNLVDTFYNHGQNLILSGGKGEEIKN